MIEKCTIFTRSEEEAADLLRFLEKLGCTWASGELPTSYVHFSSVHGGTTYWVSNFEEDKITYSSMLHPDPDYDCAADFIAAHQLYEPIEVDVMEVL